MSETKKLALAFFMGVLLEKYAPEVIEDTKEMAVSTAKAVLFPIEEVIKCIERL